MPDLCGNCAMNVPRMGICGRKPILVFFSPLPPIVLIALVFSALRVQKEVGRGSWVSGWWAAFLDLAAPSSCSAFVPCFVGIEKYYVFSHHYSLPGEWSSWSSLITDISPIFPALSFLSLMNQLFFPSWRFSSQLGSAPIQGPRPARPKSTGNWWLFTVQVASHFKDFRFDLIFPITWWHYLIVGGRGGQGEEEHSGHLRGRENPNKAKVGCASALDACLWRWAMDQQMMNYPSLGMS